MKKYNTLTCPKNKKSAVIFVIVEINNIGIV